MKISFVSDTYPPQVNGIATTLKRLVEGLRKKGHRVDLIRPAFLQSREEGLGVGSVPLPAYREIRVGLPQRLGLRSRWRDSRPDAVCVATPWPLGASAISAAKDLGIPVVSFYHTNFQEYMEHYRVPFLAGATRRYQRSLHNRADLTFVPTRGVERELAGDGYQHLELLPRGVDSDLFSPARRSEATRKSWGLPENGLAGLYVGRMAREKNISLVMETFTTLKELVPTFQGILVGGGPRLRKWKSRHPEFLFAGEVSGPELPAIYASADLFVFPSTTETFGNVTLEAMASGLAVLAYDYAAAGQYIENGVNGFVAPLKEENPFVELAERAIQSDLSDVGKRARETAEEAGWGRVIDRLEGYLGSIGKSSLPGLEAVGSPF